MLVPAQVEACSYASGTERASRSAGRTGYPSTRVCPSSECHALFSNRRGRRDRPLRHPSAIAKVVGRSELDIATFAIDDQFLRALGKEIVPLEWPPRLPAEGRGIMLAGYPGTERSTESSSVDFGLYTALGIARTVSDEQITWLIEREWQLEGSEIPAPPPYYALGGVSGGPLITWLETDGHSHELAGRDNLGTPRL
jgi:hypothetical protein